MMQTQTITIIEAWQDRFEDFLRQEYRAHSHRQPGEKTVKIAIQHVRVFAAWWQAKFQDDFTPDKLTNYDLHAYRQWSLDQERVAAATWNNRLWALGILCLWIEMIHGAAYSNLMEGVEQKAQVRGSTRHRGLSDDEYHRLVHELEQDPRRAVTAFEYQSAMRDWAAVSLMLHAGLRVEEASLLDIEDVTINERSGSVLVRNGKGSKERKVPLNLAVRRALTAWLDLRPAADQQALFSGKESTRLTTRSLQRMVSRMGARIRVPELTPHWLRYTFAKRLEQTGTGLEAIRDLLGHNSIETTRRYLRSGWDELQAAVESAM